MKKEEDILRLPDIQEDFFGVGIPGLTARLLMRTDEKAIYHRSDDVYEVFRIKIGQAAEIFGKSYPKREVYPGNEDFGRIAWCYKKKENALKRYNDI